MKAVLIQMAIEGSKTLFTLLLPVLVSICIYWFRVLGKEAEERIARTKDERTRKLLGEAYSILEKVIEKVVRRMQQTVVVSLKEASKDGKLTPEEIKALKQQAYDEVLRTLSPEYANYLKQNLGSFEDYVDASIESQVLKLKGY